MTIIEQLFDDENSEPITLYDAEGTACKFNQLAVIDYEDREYAVLNPIDLVGCEENDVVIFLIDEENESLALVEDAELGQAIFEEFLALLDDEDEE